MALLALLVPLLLAAALSLSVLTILARRATRREAARLRAELRAQAGVIEGKLVVTDGPSPDGSAAISEGLSRSPVRFRDFQSMTSVNQAKQLRLETPEGSLH